MKKIVILGVNGFIGEHLIKFIICNKLSSEYNFYSFDVVQKDEIPDYLHFTTANLLEYENVRKIIAEIRPDYIINLIGCFKKMGFDTLFDLNAGITKILFQALIELDHKVSNLLLVGSAAEYGIPTDIPITESSDLKPVNLYGLTKLMQYEIASYYARNYGLNFTLGRPFNIIGKNISDSLSIGSFISQIEKCKDDDTLYVGNLESKRDFIDIGDTVEALWQILIKGKPSSVYNICSGTSISMKSILEYLILKSGKNIKIVIDKNRYKENDVPNIYGSNTKIKEDFGWYIKTDVFKSLQKALS